DVDSEDFGGGRLTVRFSNGASDTNRLAIGAGFVIDGNNVLQDSKIIGTLNVGGGIGNTNLVVKFEPAATRAVVQLLVRSITFQTVGGAAGTRVVKFSVSDGDGGLSAEATKTITVT